MNSNQITELRVYHRPKDATGAGLDAANVIALQQQGFFLDTCLRQLAVVFGHAGATAAKPAMEQLQGRHAYNFLLQTATGLNSSVPGESNILGQFRQGWNSWRKISDAEQVCRLGSFMHRLFADSRQIRREYLQGIGGNSYGSLVRKLMQPEQDARILFVGTGKFAHSIQPFFSTFETAMWNYRDTDFTVETETYCYSAAAARAAAEWATHIVLTTPVDEQNDAVWAGLATLGVNHVVHLGRRRAATDIWGRHEQGFRFSTLDDIFDLRRTQSSLRSLQIMRARAACDQLAADFAREAAQSPRTAALAQSA